MKTTLAASSILALVVASAAPLHAQLTQGNLKAPATASSSDLFLTTPGPFPILTSTVEFASSQLTRTTAGLSTATVAVGLNPGHAYTLWWVIYDNPTQCTARPCTVADIGNHGVGASVLWATGRIADASGVLSFAAHLTSGEPEGQVLVGSGVFNPVRADVQLIVRDHGAASGDAGMRHLQLTNYLTCGPDLPSCDDPQMAIHLP